MSPILPNVIAFYRTRTVRVRYSGGERTEFLQNVQICSCSTMDCYL